MKGLDTSDKVNFYSGIATRVVDLTGSDLLDCHNGSDRIGVGIGWNRDDEESQRQLDAQ
jgi:hypothetical protein